MKRIKTLEALRLHKSKLKLELQQSEQTLTTEWKYLQANARKLLWRQINPFKDSSFVDGLLSVLQPSLVPLILGTINANDKEGKSGTKMALTTGIKYLIGTLGLKWLRKWIQAKDSQEESTEDNEQIDNNKVV